MELLSLGFSSALSAQNLFYCFVGVFLGTVIGVLPGIGPIATISMLLPLSFYLEPTTALIMLSGIYYGSAYGGSTTSILLNVPGEASSAVTALDGYPMARSGQAGVALFTAGVASFVGGTIGIVVLMILSPFLVNAALAFGPAEYFSVMVLGLIAATGLGHGTPSKTAAAVVLGLLLGCIGIDTNSGLARFNFGFFELYDGVGIATLAMALFGITEIVSSAGGAQSATFGNKIRLREMLPTRQDVKAGALPTLRGTAIGSFFGALPGAGGTIASFFSYAVEKRSAKDPSRFGKGAIEGIAGPEAAGNAAYQTAFIPTLTLGIPGSGTMAVILGAIMLHGVTPGPMLMTNHPEMFWGLVASFWIGNVMLLILNLPMIGIWVKLLSVPYHYLFPVMIVLICIGTLSISNSLFDIWLVLLIGAVGYFMRLAALSPAPLLLGFILGPMIEINLRRAMVIYQGDFSMLFSRPISGTVLVIALLVAAWSIYSALRSLLGSQQATAE